jgi:hypothetical protein
MLFARHLSIGLFVTALIIPGATLVSAQTIPSKEVTPSAASAGTVLNGTLKGEESIDYLISAEAGQILSVDVASSNPSLYFNILPQGSTTALFIGSTSGNVADIPLPEAGTYVVRVYLMRNAARRDEAAQYALGIGLAGADFADSLTGGPDWWEVSGVGGGDALNIRSGPATRYEVIGKARNGDVMQNLGCRMTGSTRWCSIRVDGSGVQGWVAGRYLIEAAAPTMPKMPAGGPVGEGAAFDAKGFVSCAVAAEPMRECPFGVVRDGPGNAGVWIALGNGTERQILFEGGQPVASNREAAVSFEKTGDIFTITIGDERYAFPEAVVNGG